MNNILKLSIMVLLSMFMIQISFATENYEEQIKSLLESKSNILEDKTLINKKKLMEEKCGMGLLFGTKALLNSDKTSLECKNIILEVEKLEEDREKKIEIINKKIKELRKMFVPKDWTRVSLEEKMKEIYKTEKEFVPRKPNWNKYGYVENCKRNNNLYLKYKDYKSYLKAKEKYKTNYPKYNIFDYLAGTKDGSASPYSIINKGKLLIYYYFEKLSDKTYFNKLNKLNCYDLNNFYKKTKFDGENYNGALKNYKDGERITIKGDLIQGEWGDFQVAIEKGPKLIYGNDEYGISDVKVRGRSSNIGTFYKQGELKDLMTKNIDLSKIGNNGISIYLSKKLIDEYAYKNDFEYSDYIYKNYLGPINKQVELSGIIRDIDIDNDIEFCGSVIEYDSELGKDKKVNISCRKMIGDLKYKFLKGEIDIEEFKKEVNKLLDNIIKKPIKQNTKIFVVDKIKKGDNYFELKDISKYKNDYKLSQSYKNKLNKLLENKLFPLEKKKKGTLFKITKKIDKIIKEKKLKKGTKTYEILKYIQNKIYYGNKEKNELLKSVLDDFRAKYYNEDLDFFKVLNEEIGIDLFK